MMLKWKAVLLHDKQQQAFVYAPTKSDAIGEILHYAIMYQSEEFDSMEIRVRKIKNKKCSSK